VTGPGTYEAVVVDIPPKGTVLLYTDGLVERRGEVLDVGLERLREAAAQNHTSISTLLDDLGDRLTPDGATDDIAILGVQWKS